MNTEQTKPDFRFEDADEIHITARDLRDEIAHFMYDAEGHAEDGRSVICYHWSTTDDKGYRHGQCVVFDGPAGIRVGVCLNGDSSYTDVEDHNTYDAMASEAITRYLTDTMIL